MQKILVTLAILCGYTAVHAQLAHTRWKGTLQLDSPMDVYFVFTSDTLQVVSAEDNSTLETNKYHVQDSVLSLAKMYGQSECDTTTGTYKIAIAGKELSLKVMTDLCDQRAALVGSMKLNEE